MQDFAGYRNTMNIEASEAGSTGWAPDIPSVIIGILVGVFVVIIGFKVAEYRIGQAPLIEAPIVENTEDGSFVFEFYDALKVYEVLPRSSWYE